VDLRVKPTTSGTAWELVDLLARSMGSIRQTAPNEFTIHPEGHALTTMAGIERGSAHIPRRCPGGDREAYSRCLPSRPW